MFLFSSAIIPSVEIPSPAKTFFKISNNNTSQIVLASHETCLLDLKFVRKDEIWFISKDKYGISKVYSLEQFKPRADLEIRKAQKMDEKLAEGWVALADLYYAQRVNALAIDNYKKALEEK